MQGMPSMRERLDAGGFDAVYVDLEHTATSLETTEIAEIVNRNAPSAVRGTRLAIRKTLSLPTYEAELLAENYRMKVAITDDAQEGARAFLQKRDPDWKVR